MIRGKGLLSAGALIAILVAPGPCTRAQPFSHRLIVDTETPHPSRPGTFSLNGFPRAVIGNGRVAFVGADSTAHFGLYEWVNGAISVIADGSVPVPGGTGTFQSQQFSNPAMQARDLVFIGAGSTTAGVYARFDGPLFPLYDNNTPPPAGYSNFALTPSEFSLSEQAIAFRGVYGSTRQNRGVFLRNTSGFTTVADAATTIPGGSGTFTDFTSWTLVGPTTTIAGVGTGNQVGIYRRTAGTLSMLVNQSTPVPGGGGAFDGFLNLSADSEDLAFIGGITGPRGEGLFTLHQGALNLIADATMDPPGPDPTYGQFGALSYRDGVLAFNASGTTVYAYMDGAVRRIVGFGDMVDGRMVTAAILSPSGLDNSEVAVSLEFGGALDYKAVYVFTIPAPAGGGLLAAAGLLAGRRRR